MKLSDYTQPKISFCGANVYVVKQDGYERPMTRLEQFFTYMKQFERWGDWNIVEKVTSACCDGGIVATLSGARGRVEVWNNGEVYLIQKHGEPILAESVSKACSMACIQEKMFV